MIIIILNMRTIIHDLKEKDLKHLKLNKDDILISSKDCKNHCIGCFSCWVKYPKKCTLNDEYSNIIEHLKNSDELIISFLKNSNMIEQINDDYTLIDDIIE